MIVEDLRSLPENLEAYILEHSSPEPELLKQLRQEASATHLRHRMMSGALQGRLLSVLSRLKQPRTILEIGTFTAYATLCLAEGLSGGGRLITIERSDEAEDFIRKYIQASSYKQAIHLIIGDALEILPQLDFKTVDLVYIDANKREYIAYLDLISERLPQHALLLTDNTLWDAKVIDPYVTDEQTQKIRAFNTYLKESTAFTTFILPIRDGLSISIKN